MSVACAAVAATCVMAGGLATAAATTTSGNLLAGDTATLTASAGAWTTTGATQWTVNGALATTTGATAPSWVVSQTGTGTNGIAVTPGGIYTATAKVLAAGTGRGISLALSWYDATGQELAADRASGQAVTDSSASWTDVRVAGIAPDTAAYVTIAEVIWYPGASETHYLTTPSLTATTGGSAALQGPFTVTGATVHDANGNVVVFRGVNRYGLEMTADPASFTRNDVDRVKAWGANVVRVPLGEQFWLSTKCQYDSGYAARVRKVVDWINADGMLALLDLHWSTTSACGTPGQQSMADYPASVTFWQQVATAYKNWPLVAFDLYNEPQNISDQVWRNGGKATSNGVAYKAAGMQQLYKAVRGTGADNLVFVSGNTDATTWPTTAPISGSNVVYAVHAYNCGAPPCTAGYDPTWVLQRFTGHGVPVMVTEFGWPDGRDGTFLDNVISWAEGQGWGWSAWAWDSDGTCRDSAYWDLIATNDCGAGLAYEPSAAGVPVLIGLERN